MDAAAAFLAQGRHVALGIAVDITALGDGGAAGAGLDHIDLVAFTLQLIEGRAVAGAALVQGDGAAVAILLDGGGAVLGEGVTGDEGQRQGGQGPE